MFNAQLLRNCRLTALCGSALQRARLSEEIMEQAYYDFESIPLVFPDNRTSATSKVATQVERASVIITEEVEDGGDKLIVTALPTKLLPTVVFSPLRNPFIPNILNAHSSARIFRSGQAFIPP